MANNTGAPNPAGLRAASGYMPVSMHWQMSLISQRPGAGDDAEIFVVGTIWPHWKYAYQCPDCHGWRDRYDVLVSEGEAVEEHWILS